MRLSMLVAACRSGLIAACFSSCPQTIRKGPPCPPTHGKVARLGTAFRGVNAQQGRRNHAAGTAQKTAKAPREARESNDESIPCGLTNDEAGDSIKVCTSVFRPYATSSQELNPETPFTRPHKTRRSLCGCGLFPGMTDNVQVCFWASAVL